MGNSEGLLTDTHKSLELSCETEKSTIANTEAKRLSVVNGAVLYLVCRG